MCKQWPWCDFLCTFMTVNYLIIFITRLLLCLISFISDRSPAMWSRCVSFLGVWKFQAWMVPQSSKRFNKNPEFVIITTTAPWYSRVIKVYKFEQEYLVYTGPFLDLYSLSGRTSYQVRIASWSLGAAGTLRWRHNGRDSVSNHQPHDCLLNLLFRRRSKKTSKLRVTGLCAGNSPGPVNSPQKWPVTRKMFPFDDVIMRSIYTIWDRMGWGWGRLHSETEISSFWRNFHNWLEWKLSFWRCRQRWNFVEMRTFCFSRHENTVLTRVGNI